ncbi:hypothetical protein [Niastella sp. OAS944]|uniref:hypothetical protein n=1 Tax=Niastella sp. OAS944 TaxID=2664089 RepID=UPI00348CA89D|nr:hypothetical protein [Chitinophagaceae bacterium OAS944]
MILLNDNAPIGQLEVVPAAEGDYRIYVPVMPVIEPVSDSAIQIVQTCFRLLTFIAIHLATFYNISTLVTCLSCC